MGRVGGREGGNEGVEGVPRVRLGFEFQQRAHKHGRLHSAGVIRILNVQDTLEMGSAVSCPCYIP